VGGAEQAGFFAMLGPNIPDVVDALQFGVYPPIRLDAQIVLPPVRRLDEQEHIGGRVNDRLTGRIDADTTGLVWVGH
jgi:hypothetical protein